MRALCLPCVPRASVCAARLRSSAVSLRRRGLAARRCGPRLVSQTSPLHSPRGPGRAPQAVEGAPAVVSEVQWSLACAEAHWVDGETLLLPLATPAEGPLVVTLCSSPTASLEVDAIRGVHGPDASRVQLVQAERGNLGNFPHLHHLATFRLHADADAATRRALLKCQLAVEVREAAGGALLFATGVQTAGALDSLCAYDGPLGAQLHGGGGGGATLRVWAPTAQRVQLLLFDGAQGGLPAATLDLSEGERGVWSASGADWQGRWYAYRVTAFHWSTGRVETCDASDPYARALAANGARVLIADIVHESLLPPGWEGLRQRKPRLEHHADCVIYELHVRDFSATDATVPPHLRGTFEAFTLDSAGTRHLAALARSGVTHVHLLPVYDFGSVDEQRERWQEARGPGGVPLDSLPPDSEEQQAAVTAVADRDAYNWGYDPVHWGVPDGSYCTQPDGAQRSLQLRRAVSALNALGLRVVLDVVYNHVYASGPHAQQSVLDKLVPSYYLRRDERGGVCDSTCMNNTASEHTMCERLILDDLMHWAKNYGVDGFRFDLMGHLMKRLLVRAREALDAEGLGDVVLYGEGWDYAEVEGGRRGANGSQRGLAGSGVGTFNDRIREAATGANPFGDPRLQGVLTGLWTQPWAGAEQGTRDEQRAALGRATERVLAGVAGNLAGFTFTGADGHLVAGRDAGGRGSGCGYATAPAETVNYVSAHDNETLWDLVALKLPPDAGAAARARVVLLAQALLAWSQGIPFFHAGDELLRSKSLDRDSYNSGDHFNALDWSGARTGWGVGLPPAPKNRHAWHMMAPLLADPKGAPSREQALAASALFRELLAVRASSPLFRLRSEAEVQARLRLHNRGPSELPGLLVWELRDEELGPARDPRFQRLLMLLNATTEQQSLAIPDIGHLAWRLHPSLRSDATTALATCRDGAVSMPPLTAACFVVERF